MRDSPSGPITVEENHYRFLWGLITVLSLLIGGLLFDPLQNSGSFFEQYGLIILISLLFTSGIWGIYRTIQPLYSANLHIEDHTLSVNIFYGEDEVNQQEIDLQHIETITFRHCTPPGPGEALYDFSTDYLAVYRTKSSLEFHPLIDISPEKMTLKIQDIADIIKYIKSYQPDIHIPNEDQKILGI